jgi:tRNA (guanine-N7-)-methyltransferase
MTDSIHRPIKSFVRRMGRLTKAQQDALTQLWPRYGLEVATLPDSCMDWFQSDVPLTVEIGFGDGDCLMELANTHPQRHYLGFEVHDPGVGHALLQAHRLDLKNVRLIHDDAQAILQRSFLEGSIDEVLIYFPDPWHKLRHHKRRLVQPPFLRLLARLIKSGGVVRLATDWAEYAEWMLKAFAEVPQFENTATPGPFIPRPPERPETKFERRGIRLGQPAADLCFKRNQLPLSAPDTPG